MSVRQVPLLDLRRISPELEHELEEAFRRVLRSGHYILGPEVEALEHECAAYVGAKYAIGVSSGTDALLLALMTLGIEPGDEVICPTYTFFATAGTIWRLGARPVFVDSCPLCFNLSPGQVASKITARTKAIMPVHLFGQCAEMGPILRVAEQHGIPVIEDAAQALGAQYGQRRAGSLGSLGCFSFFPSKNLGALGDAGLVVTSDPTLAEKARILRSHGGKPKYHHQMVGGNFRIDALQAALIRVKLRRLDEATARRHAHASAYRTAFVSIGAAEEAPRGCPCTGAPGSTADAVMALPAEVQSRHIYNQFVVRLHERDRIRSFLAEDGIATEVYYPVPMHLQKCFEALGHREGEFPFAEAAARDSLALPIFPELTEDELSYVTSAVSKGLAR